LHDPAQGNISDLKKKVEMIFHQCIGIKVEGVPVLAVREIGKESLQVFSVKKDPLPSIPSADDMVQCSWEMDPRFTGHGIRLSNNDVRVNTELPKPDPNVFQCCMRIVKIKVANLYPVV
jgi:hypothetical protein